MTDQSHIPTLDTARLRLRPFRITDTDRLLGIMEGEKVLQYFPPRPEALDRERVARLIQRQIDHWTELGYGWWAVEDRLSGDLLGWNGLQLITETGEVEIGYLLDRSSWGKGLATEGGQAAFRFAREKLRLSELVGITHPDNAASQNVLRKLGLTFTRVDTYFGMEVWRFAHTFEE